MGDPLSATERSAGVSVRWVRSVDLGQCLDCHQTHPVCHRFQKRVGTPAQHIIHRNEEVFDGLFQHRVADVDQLHVEDTPTFLDAGVVSPQLVVGSFGANGKEERILIFTIVKLRGCALRHLRKMKLKI